MAEPPKITYVYHTQFRGVPPTAVPTLKKVGDQVQMHIPGWGMLTWTPEQLAQFVGELMLCMFRKDNNHG